MKSGVLLFTLTAILGVTAAVQAEDNLPQPEWGQDSDSLYVSYKFPTGDPAPAPESVNNPHGPVLSEVFVDSPMGIGWVDPEGPNQSFTRGDSGAWDLGPAGSIAVTVPLWDVGDGTGDVRFAVNIIAFSGFFDLPTLSVAGHEVTELEIFLQTLESTPPWGSWMSGSFIGTLVGVKEQDLTFLLLAHPNSGSLVDTVEIYVIPEPRVYAAIFGLVALGFAALRRRHSGARGVSVARR